MQEEVPAAQGWELKTVAGSEVRPAVRDEEAERLPLVPGCLSVSVAVAGVHS